MTSVARRSRNMRLCAHVLPLIAEMLKRNFDFQLGPHTESVPGYYACFQPPDAETCPECGELAGYWAMCGHALDLNEAIVMAYCIANGQTVDTPSSRDLLDMVLGAEARRDYRASVREPLPERTRTIQLR